MERVDEKVCDVLAELELSHLFREGEEAYVPFESALQFARKCCQRGLTILGVECLEQRGSAIIPREDLIADWTIGKVQSPLTPEASLRETERFLALAKAKGRHMLVAFSFSDDESQ